MPTYEQYTGAIETIAMYLSRYSTGTVELTNVEMNDYLVNISCDVDGTPIVDEIPIEFPQFSSAIQTMAAYCQEQRIPESTTTPLVLGNGVIAEYTTQWTAAGIYDQTTHALILTRNVGEQVSTINLDGTTKIRVD